MYGDRWTIKEYEMRTAGDVTLPLAIDRADPRPLPRQLADELRTAIGNGLVAAGEPVPASRALAQRLGVSRGTVVSAYDQLLAKGWVHDRAVPDASEEVALREQLVVRGDDRAATLSLIHI